VATVVQDRGTEAGPQRVVWNGQSMNGTAAPTGLYLVRVTARAAEGSQSSALAAVSLR
jgi:flagellar hook assembly protein FlgD